MPSEERIPLIGVAPGTFFYFRPRQSASRSSRLERERSSPFLLSALDRTKHASRNGSKKLPKCSRNLSRRPPRQPSQHLTKNVILVVLGTSENLLNALLGPVLSFSALFFQNGPKKLLKCSQSLLRSLSSPFPRISFPKDPRPPDPQTHHAPVPADPQISLTPRATDTHTPHTHRPLTPTHP